MADYIVCHRKRNSPRLSIRICEEKCPFKEACKEYTTHLKVSLHHSKGAVSRESVPVVSAMP